MATTEISIAEADLVALSEMHHKFVANSDSLYSIIQGYKNREYKVSATIGTYDVLHVGHMRYLTNARKQGDILVVGVDTDEVVNRVKGDLRPIIPFRERVEMLSYQKCVDIITPLDDLDENLNWQYGLLRTIKPNVFVAEATSYSEEQIADIKRYCDRVVVLPRQAEGTSSSMIMDNLVRKTINKIYEQVHQRPGHQ